MKFRKKPIIVDAEQFDGTIECAERLGVTVSIDPSPQIFQDEKREKRFYIQTSEGIENISAGDWVITGIDGEKFPCRSSVFNQTYTPVEGNELVENELIEEEANNIMQDALDKDMLNPDRAIVYWEKLSNED